MNTIEKWIETDTAHRVPKHESKCKNIHGHRYRFTAELVGDLYTDGPQSGMVMDFSFVKELMVENIDHMIDHAIIISTQDQKFFHMAYDEKLTTKKSDILVDWVNEVELACDHNGFWAGHTTFGKTYIIADFPTAENLARHFFRILEYKVTEMTSGRATLSAMIVDETPTSRATYRP
jgi:6-pyruvoyltetrahydropterin/6-carboxytetrahydropterin synthase